MKKDEAYKAAAKTLEAIRLLVQEYNTYANSAGLSEKFLDGNMIETPKEKDLEKLQTEIKYLKIQIKELQEEKEDGWVSSMYCP